MSLQNQVKDKRRIRKVMLFFEDDTRAPQTIDGSGIAKVVQTIIRTDNGSIEPVTFHEIIMNPPAGIS